MQEKRAQSARRPADRPLGLNWRPAPPPTMKELLQCTHPRRLKFAPKLCESSLQSLNATAVASAPLKSVADVFNATKLSEQLFTPCDTTPVQAAKAAARTLIKPQPPASARIKLLQQLQPSDKKDREDDQSLPGKTTVTPLVAKLNSQFGAFSRIKTSGMSLEEADARATLNRALKMLRDPVQEAERRNIFQKLEFHFSSIFSSSAGPSVTPTLPAGPHPSKAAPRWRSNNEVRYRLVTKTAPDSARGFKAHQPNEEGDFSETPATEALPTPAQPLPRRKLETYRPQRTPSDFATKLLDQHRANRLKSFQLRDKREKEAFEKRLQAYKKHLDELEEAEARRDVRHQLFVEFF